jgi:hypothetical protein
MKDVGNTKANTIWQHHIASGYYRLTESSTRDERERFIRAKYVDGLFREDHPSYSQQLGNYLILLFFFLVSLFFPF